MDLTFLGTSSGTPTAERNTTGVALRTEGGWDLFDCGEGTQHRLLQTTLSLAKLRRIFISHLHGDHCFGIFGLLASRAMSDATGPVTVLGPAGLERMVRLVMEASSTHLTFPLEFIEVPDDGDRIHLGTARIIDAVPLTHRVTSFAWSIREPDRPGVFDVRRAQVLGVPEGPGFGRLQHGEAVELADGTVIQPEEVVGPARPGRSVVIAGDNSDPAKLLATTGPVQLLVHEATYTEATLAALGEDRGHSTAARVARAAEEGGVATLILTHFSPRYEGTGSAESLESLRSEAASHFGGELHLANDLDQFIVDVDGKVRKSTPRQ